MTTPARPNPGSCFRDLDEARRILRPRSRNANPEKDASDRLERLRRTISHAYEEVPYYRGIFDRSGIRPADLRSLDDLGKLPLTAKLDFQTARREDLVSDRFDPDSLLVFKTSGSTGIPIDIIQSRWENFIFHLIKFRTLRSLGLSWRDRTIKIRNRSSSRPPEIWSILKRLGFLRQETIDAGSPEEMTAAIRGKEADVVMGYTGTLVRIAQFLADDPGRTLRPRFLVCGSETMTPFFRSEIRRGFGAPVVDTYICQEAGMVAWECPDSGRYHVLDDTLIVEVLRDGAPCGPGEEGEVIVTSLVSRAMPIIRYRLGDVVRIAQGECPCGRREPAFDRILGKTQDHFWLPGGREFNPWHLSGLWTGAAPWIRQYEIVQETPGSIVMRIVPAASPPPGDMAALGDRSRKILGPDVDFRVELVSDIRPGPGGKLRFHRSLVRSIYDNPMDGEWLKP